VHRREAARHRRDSLKGRVRDNVLVVEARAARQPEAEDLTWPI
jgi:hypothetical protein